ncbi:MAG: acyl-ACP--UDP-N-acetylglucosamine O-acyltransferase [Candidatus Omnitrophica bacterium]|nr:acyl-ACP--UDP-N-acetylglucosamine O-acyltransferase [Candidatus Omnitrophota bacterium]
MAINIHPKAVVSKAAILEDGVSVGPYSVIDDGVTLGKNVCVNAHAHVKGNTYIGEGSFIGSGAVLGEAPQSVGATGGGKLRIGKNNIIREYVTIHSSLSKDTSTILGDDNFLMIFSHIGHDCKIANNVITCPGALVGGHVELSDRVFISGGVAVHQFARIGRGAMISGLARVNQDVPPFMLVVGDSRVWGINVLGAKRAKLNSSDLKELKKAYTIIYRKKLSITNALKELENSTSEVVKEIIIFILASKRGVCGPKRNSFLERMFLDYPYLLRSKLPAFKAFAKEEKLRKRLSCKR